jgi:hypothetical protein
MFWVIFRAQLRQSPLNFMSVGRAIEVLKVKN